MPKPARSVQEGSMSPKHSPPGPPLTSLGRLTDRANHLLPILIVVGLLVPLAGHAWLGSYSRYIADDYCTAGMLQRFGFWGSQAYWYRSWSGRFTFTLLANLTHLAGPWLTRWLPSMAIVLWLLTLGAFARRWTRELRTTPPHAAVDALAALPLFLTLEGTPNPYQSLYWQTGMLTYALPLILATLYLWSILGLSGTREVHKRRSRLETLASGLFAFFAGGFSETYVSLQTAALAACLAFAVTMLRGPQRVRVSRFVIAGLIGSALAMALIVVAPGSDVRRSLMPPPPGLLELISNTLRDWWIFVYRVAKYQTALLSLALLVPAWLGYQTVPDEEAHRIDWRNRDVWVRLLGLPMITALLVMVPFAPSEYAISSYPDERVIITQEYVHFMGIVCWAYSTGHLARALVHPPWIRKTAAVFVIGVSLLAILGLSVWTALQQVRAAAPFAQSYAVAWEARDRTLTTAADDGIDALAVPPLRHMGGLAEIEPDPDTWVNVCLAATYGLRSVTALP